MPEEKKLSDALKSSAQEAREEATGYGLRRNIFFVSLVGATALSNLLEDINSMSPENQLIINTAGVSLAVVLGLEMERARRKLQRAAKDYDKIADELKAQNL